MKYSIVIIGGGPAGIAAGIQLSKAGKSVALIEKKTYPREKTCAGILTQKTVSLLKEQFSLTELKKAFSTRHISIMYKGACVNKLSVQQPFTFVDRRIFDFELLNICREAGTHIMDGIMVTKLFPQKNTLLLSNNEYIEYNCLIIADGVHSTTRKHLGLANIPVAFCIQDTIKRCQCKPPFKNLQELLLNFGYIPFGYSWLVPSDENIVVGSGMFMNNVDSSILLDKHTKLCTQMNLPNSMKRRGAFVPIGRLANQTEHPYENIILIGDAAGLANPLTGEGIFHALLSGVYASKSYLLNPLKFRSTYLSLLQPITAQIIEQTKLLTRFYDNTLLENLFFQFKDSPEYLASICDDVVSLESKSYQLLINELQSLFR